MSETALSAIAEINPGARIPKEITGSDEVSFIPMSDVSESGDWITRQTRPLRSVTAGFTAFEEGDVLVAKITPCLENGKGAHAQGLRNGIGFGSTEFHVLRARSGVEPRFVFHITQSRRFRQAAERQMVGSAGQQRVQRQFFDEFLVRDFSQNEQRAIAQILDTLDTAIRETEALIDKLKAVKQGLLHDLLTRGIDTNGHLRPPQNEAPQLYKESPLGWIPREWELSTVGVEFEIQLGKMLDAQKNSGAMKPYLGNKAVQWDRIDPNEVQQMALSIADMERFRLRPGDLLVCEGGDVGRAAIWEEQLDECYYQKALHRLRPVNGFSTRLMLELLRYWMGRDVLFEYISKTSIAHFTQEKFASVPLPVPSTDEQNRLVSVVLAHKQRQEQEEDALKKLMEEKQGLMNDLLTGRVRVTPLLPA